MDTTNINTNKNTEKNTNTDPNIHFFLEDLTEDKLEDNENMLQQLLQEFENQELDMNMNMGGNTGAIDDLGYFMKKQLYTGNEELYYDEEYTVKDLMKICQYYGIAKNIKASKCKKSDIISTIIYFENSVENIEIVNNRHKMWAYMTELINDSKMKQYLLW